jgi:hypothetical protein
MSQLFIVDLGWVFFAAWGIVLSTLTAIAFGRDILGLTGRAQEQRRQRG